MMVERVIGCVVCARRAQHVGWQREWGRGVTEQKRERSAGCIQCIGQVCMAKSASSRLQIVVDGGASKQQGRRCGC